MALYGFEFGRLYHRQRDIHEVFQGQQQSGIVTPAQYPVIFAFTGGSGRTHGYEDYWTDDGVFCFYGEGRRDDMIFQKGNAAIRDHITNGEDLLLFEMERGGVRFRGPFICESWDQRPAPDADGNTRQAIVFHLVPAEGQFGVDAADDVAEEGTDSVGDFEQLRNAAYSAGTTAPERRARQSRTNFTERSQTVRRYVLARADGECEACYGTAPFVREDGSPFLELHHIKRLSDGGPDDPRHVAGICPNCHREAHYGDNRNELNRQLLKHVENIESRR